MDLATLNSKTRRFKTLRNDYTARKFSVYFSIAKEPYNVKPYASFSFLKTQPKFGLKHFGVIVGLDDSEDIYPHAFVEFRPGDDLEVGLVQSLVGARTWVTDAHANDALQGL